MPIQQITRVNPLDLQGNIAIGVSLPFDGPAGPFNKTYSTADQTKYNLINLLLTNKGERVFNPEFGTDLRKALFEAEVEDTYSYIQELITNSTGLFVPEVQVTEIQFSPDENNNSISITVKYKLRISGNSDEITVQFI
jgi:phage baseplate assembly protein W